MGCTSLNRRPVVELRGIVFEECFVCRATVLLAWVEKLGIDSLSSSLIGEASDDVQVLDSARYTSSKKKQ